MLNFGILTGWKAWSGGIILVLTGAAGVLGLVARSIADAAEGRWTEAFTTFQSVEFVAAMAAIGNGIATFGIGDKVERAAVGELGPEVKAAEAAAKKG